MTPGATYPIQSSPQLCRLGADRGDDGRVPQSRHGNAAGKGVTIPAALLAPDRPKGDQLTGRGMTAASHIVAVEREGPRVPGPSPGTRIATAPASRAWRDAAPTTAREGTVRRGCCPANRAVPTVRPAWQDLPPRNKLKATCLVALAGRSAAIETARHADTSHLVQAQIMRPFCQV